MARESGLNTEYVKEYFTGCKHVHSMLSALVDREAGQRYLPEAIYGFTNTVTSTCVLLMVYFRLPPEINDEALQTLKNAVAARNEEG